MNRSDSHRRDTERRSPARRNGTAALIIALTAAFAFGAIDQYVGGLRSSFLTGVSGMSAPWLLVPFLAGAWQPRQRRAALAGLAATWLSVFGYVLMIVSPMEGTHLGPRPAGLTGSWTQLSPHLFLATLASQWLWFAGGLLTGPLYGWLGYRSRSRRSWATALVAVLPVLLEPVARVLVGRFGLAYVSGLPFRGQGGGPAAITEVAVGLLLTGVVVTAMFQRGRPSRPGATGSGQPGAG
jgi:hypothetical protein